MNVKLAVFALIALSTAPAVANPWHLEEQRPLPANAAVLAPLALNAEIKDWLEPKIDRRASVERRMVQVFDALNEGRGGLGEVQFPKATPTAIEAFKSRSVNCVGFALLYVALARESGVPAFFVVVPQRRDGSREGDLRVIEDHLAAGAVADGRLVVYDLAGRYRRGVPAARPVSDLTALSVFQSNRGTELLARGRTRDAVKRLQLAIELDPELTAAWVNLGVSRRRIGDSEGAEAAYRRALELDPQHPGARDNLVHLLQRKGRREEALHLEMESNAPDPLAALSQAAARLQQGELEAARSLYLQALALSQ